MNRNDESSRSSVNANVSKCVRCTVVTCIFCYVSKDVPGELLVIASEKKKRRRKNIKDFRYISQVVMGVIFVSVTFCCWFVTIITINWLVKKRQLFGSFGCVPILLPLLRTTNLLKALTSCMIEHFWRFGTSLSCSQSTLSDNLP